MPYGVKVLVAEGLHPFHDERVRDLMDVKIYLDISDEVKFAWKIQRDMKERGHSLESIKASIAARKHDFDAYIDPQKKHADIIIQVSNQLRMHPFALLFQQPRLHHLSCVFKSYVCAASIAPLCWLPAFCAASKHSDASCSSRTSITLSKQRSGHRQITQRAAGTGQADASVSQPFTLHLLTLLFGGDQVLPTQLIPDEKEGKVLRVRMIQKEGIKFFDPAYLFDEGSTISWIPCGRKLTCSFPGIKFFYGPDTYFGEEVPSPLLNAQNTTAISAKNDSNRANLLERCQSSHSSPCGRQTMLHSLCGCLGIGPLAMGQMCHANMTGCQTGMAPCRFPCWRWTASLTSWRS